MFFLLTVIYVYVYIPFLFICNANCLLWYKGRHLPMHYLIKNSQYCKLMH